MKCGALTYILLLLVFIATLVLIAFALSTGNRELALWGLSGLPLSLILFLFYKYYAASAHCPLCRGAVLGGSSAVRNRRAKRTFGSHRLRVCRTILLTNTFTCPFCNEQTRCVVKERPRGGQVSRQRSASRR